MVLTVEDGFDTDKGAAGVDLGRPGLDDLDSIQVDLDVEASRSTGSGFGWPAWWSLWLAGWAAGLAGWAA